MIAADHNQFLFRQGLICPDLCRCRQIPQPLQVIAPLAGIYHADGLGSVVALTDNRGRIAQKYEYDSFGNQKNADIDIVQPFTYTGREWDKETGLYYYRARYYDPMEGRFIQKDPIGFNGGINLYNYVEANPTNYTDPFGLDPVIPMPSGFRGGLPNWVNTNPTGPTSFPNPGGAVNGINNNLNVYAQRNADAAAESAIDAVERTMDCRTTANYMIIYGTSPIRFIALEPVGQASLTTQGVRRVPRTLRGIRGCECR